MLLHKVFVCIKNAVCSLYVFNTLTLVQEQGHTTDTLPFTWQALCSQLTLPAVLHSSFLISYFHLILHPYFFIITLILLIHFHPFIELTFFYTGLPLANMLQMITEQVQSTSCCNSSIQYIFSLLPSFIPTISFPKSSHPSGGFKRARMFAQWDRIPTMSLFF